MKFGRQLDFNAVPEWREFYVSYSALKKILKRLVATRKEANKQRSTASGPQGFSEGIVLEQALLRDDEEPAVEEDSFFCVLDSDIERVNTFFLDKQAALQNTTKTLEELSNQSVARKEESERRTLRSLFHGLYSDLDELRNFSMINMTGFHKILKKYDKMMGSDARKQYAPTLQAQPFASTALTNSIIADVEVIYANKFEQGDKEKAFDELTDALREYVVFKRNTVWQELIARERKSHSISATTKGYAFKKWPLLAAIILAGLMLVIPIMSETNWEAHKCLGLLVFTSVLWAFEALPLYATALSVPFLSVVMRIPLESDSSRSPMSAKDASTYILSEMSGSVIFLILGGFSIAGAVSKFELDRRVAQWVLHHAGASPEKLRLYMMFMGVFLSMWISNVAAPVLCVSVILPILHDLHRSEPYVKSMLMSIAIACNLGGTTTPIASPQNAIALHVVEDLTDGKVEISFFEWMAVAIPTCLVLLVIAFGFIRFTYKSRIKTIHVPPLAKPVPLGLRGYYVIGISLVTVLLWCLESHLEGIFGTVGIIGLIPVVFFFGAGILDKDDFNNLPWNVVYLVAGGSALGAAVESSRLLKIIGNHLEEALEGHGTWLMLLVFCIFVVVVTTFVSHTVSAIVILPIICTLGISIGHPRLFTIVATLMTSGSMGLPISSFPNVNAISVEDSAGAAYLKATDFMRIGLPMSAFGLVVFLSLGYGIAAGLE